MGTIEGNLLRGHLEAMVLATLEQGDAHGFEIMQRLDGEAKGAFHLKEGTLYPVLYRLENAGHVKGRWDDETGKSRGPRRRIYKITKRGTRELEKRRTTWQHFVSVVGSIVEA